MRLTFLLFAAFIAVAALYEPGPPGFLPTQAKGAWLAASGGTPLEGAAAITALLRLKSLGVDTVALGPDVMQPRLDAPELTWGTHDESLRFVLRAARELGLKTFVMPRVESPDFFKPPFPWRGKMTFTDPKVREAWYANYRSMIAHYGQLCREESVSVLGIGLEYRQLVKADPKEWRGVAKTAREAFGGTITYSANWDDYDQVLWWDAVDVIGIGAYFEVLEDGLPDQTYVDTATLVSPTLRQIEKGWQPIKEKLKALSASVGRPIWFTEVGFTTYADTNYYPWRWQAERKEDPAQQALAYRALIRTFVSEPWWHGASFWRFYTRDDEMPSCRYRLTPESLFVLRDAWSRSTPR